MAKDTILLIVVGGALVFAGGCATVRGTGPVKIDQSSPQALAASFHEAVQSKNFAAMLECMEPSKQGEYDSLLAARRRLAQKTEPLAKLIEAKIGRKHAQMYLQMGEETAMFSPFDGAVNGDKVDWGKVKFKVEGTRASASIDGETSFHFKMIKGKWYMTQAPEEDTFSGWIMRQAVKKRLDATAAAADRQARGIRNGTINKDNFYEKMFGVDKDEGERLSRYAATPYGPAVDGVRIRLTTWAPAFHKNERIWFSMDIKYETDDWVCWRHPGTGPGYSTWLGESVILEIDGKAIPQPEVKADQVFKWGHGSTTLGTSIYFPVNFRLPPGRHTIQYTIISRGGTYTDPDDGRKYRIINGKLVSNTLTFFVSEKTMRPVPDESGATARSAARAGATTRRSATAPDPDDPQGTRMDAVFYEALYYFMTGEATRAFQQLDKAIDTQRPTANWYLYLALYKRCFEDMTGTAPEAWGYTPKGEKLVKKLKETKDKRVPTLVKLAVLLQKGPKPPSIEPQLRAILEGHPGSVWCPWAKWKLIELRADQMTREVRRKGFSVGSQRMLAWRIGGAIQLDPERKTDRIMWKWMHDKLHASSMSSLVHAEDCLKARYAIGLEGVAKRPAGTQPAKGQRISREHWKQFFGPEWKTREYRALRVIRGLHFSPKSTPQEEVWKYFEHVRKSTVKLPAAIPSDKKSFLKNTQKRRRSR